jgi:hypothetical protein
VAGLAPTRLGNDDVTPGPISGGQVTHDFAHRRTTCGDVVGMAVGARLVRGEQQFELDLDYMSTLTLAQVTTTVQQGGGGDGVTEGDLLAVIVAIVLGVLALVGVIIQQAQSVKTSYREQTKNVEDRLSKMIEGVENGVTRLNNDLKEEGRALGNKIDDQAERSRQRDDGLRDAINDLRDRVEDVRREMSMLRMPAQQDPGREEVGALHGPLERLASATGRIERRMVALEEDMDALQDDAQRSQRQLNRRLRVLEETAGEESTQAAGPGPGEMGQDAGSPPAPGR